MAAVTQCARADTNFSSWSARAFSRRRFEVFDLRTEQTKVAERLDFMALFHLHLCNGEGLIEDEDGEDFLNLADARERAVRRCGKYRRRRSHVERFTPPLSWRLRMSAIDISPL
jgi:hypothetical protein